jgi:hypothetical protein
MGHPVFSDLAELGSAAAASGKRRDKEQRQRAETKSRDKKQRVESRK